MQIGTKLGPYEVIAKIGEGGMGEVYKAHDTRLDRPVALKFVRTPGDPRSAQQLLREARAASALNHPSVCTIHEVGESGTDAYIVMEYIEGVSLSDRIAAGRIPSEDVLAIVKSLDVDRFWEAATDHERRILIEELLEVITVLPDH